MSKLSVDLSERNKLFQKNLQYFPEYVKQQIVKVNLKEIEKSIDIVYTKEGAPICKNKKDGRVQHINSQYPWDEAKNWCNQLPLNEMSTLFVYGCGFGYPLIELLKRVHEDTFVVVFEQNLHIFIAMLYYFDLEPIFRKHNKCIFFLGSPDDFSENFQHLILTNSVFHLTVPSVLFTPSSRLFKMEYLNIQSHIFDRLKQQIFAYGSSHNDSLLGFHNMIENIKIVLENPYLTSLKDKFANVPAFIVANGPSLDKSINELKQVKGKGLILCCESAIVPLMKNGIKPDAICVSERTPDSYLYHFQNRKYPKDIALLALAVADPRTFASFAGPKVPIFRSLETTSKWFNQITGDRSGLSGGVNVSHLAYELADYMGANPIVFVGQNFAYGLDGMTHSKHSKYIDEGKGYIEKLKSLPIIYMDGNEVPFVPSNVIWERYRKGLERLIEQTPHVTAINTTKGGAKIKGTSYDSLTNVIEQYCKNRQLNRLDTLLNDCKKNVNIQDRKNKIKNLKIELKKCIEIFRAFNQLTEERKAIIQQLLDGSKAQNIELLRNAFIENSTHIMKFIRAGVHNMFFQQVIMVGYYQINELGVIHTLEKLRYALQFQMKLFENLSVICQSLVRNFQVAIEKLSTVEITSCEGMEHQ
ncbi:motility associated factor glycosyltransferase family protein [Alkalihalobacillus sp. BA299]|uniref:motility associated factor glycosyltransferase family protein n=1 Tax=Alkalihalobacillus sp. BA299 TaxID=2815938 RepID=UPI001ADA3CF1|nr:6-hydroxymethylpterin diphosphokinase MptE-like protein [Alkalihalobacillus sp. BA299]